MRCCPLRVRCLSITALILTAATLLLHFATPPSVEHANLKANNIGKPKKPAVNIQITAGNGKVTADSTILYRSYLEQRNGRQRIRIFAFRQCARNKFVRYQLQIRPRKGKAVNLPMTVETLNRQCPWHWAPSCKWSGHAIVGTLPAKFVIKGDMKSTLSVGGRSVVIPPPINIAAQAAAKKRHNLAVCIPPVYLFADWVQLVQFIELWRLQGASKFLFYTVSISANVDTVLRYYERTGLLERVVWRALPKSANQDPNKSLYRFGHIVAINDCALRLTGVATFVASVDLDEYIIPSNPTQTLVKLLESEAKRAPNAAGFSFEPERVFPDKALKVAKSTSVAQLRFGWLKSLRSPAVSPWANRTSGPSKVIFRPERVDLLATHAVVRSVPSKTKRNAPVGLSKGVLFHTRLLASQPAVGNRPQGTSNTTTYKPINAFAVLVSKLLKGLQSFARSAEGRQKMTTDFGVQRLVTKCLSTWKQTGCKTPHEMCKAVLKKQDVRWVFAGANDTTAGFLVL